jgi:hypothetical protein
MSTDVLERVLEFVSSFCKVPLDRISPATRLEEDLGLTGDDAGAFLTQFGAHFQVDLTAVEFHRHFGPEGWGCNPLWLFFPPAGMREYRKYPVTVDHLVRVAESKRWFDPPRANG